MGHVKSDAPSFRLRCSTHKPEPRLKTVWSRFVSRRYHVVDACRSVVHPAGCRCFFLSVPHRPTNMLRRTVGTTFRQSETACFVFFSKKSQLTALRQTLQDATTMNSNFAMRNSAMMRTTKTKYAASLPAALQSRREVPWKAPSSVRAHLPSGTTSGKANSSGAAFFDGLICCQAEQAPRPWHLHANWVSYFRSEKKQNEGRNDQRQQCNVQFLAESLQVQSAMPWLLVDCSAHARPASETVWTAKGLVIFSTEALCQMWAEFVGEAAFWVEEHWLSPGAYASCGLN